MNSQLTKITTIAAGMLTVVTTLLSLLGFLSMVNSGFDMLSHFRLVYVAILFILSASLIFLKNYKLFCVVLLALAVNLYPVLAMYVPAEKSASQASTTKIRILQINPQADRNHQTRKVIEYARSVDADILAVTELSKEWKDALKAGLTNYPYQVIEGRFDTGIALFSKIPIESHIVKYFPGVPIEHPQIQCSLKSPTGNINLILAHTTLPKKLVSSRNSEMQSIALDAKNSHAPCVVFGDLNCSPWSYHFQHLLDIGNLNDSEQGFGPQPTWTTEMIVPLVPIDHLLASKDFKILTRFLGPNIGSDHLPVYVELALTDLSP